MIDPQELIETSRKLLSQTAATPPSDADIRRAISTAYYAIFHALTASNADLIAGTPQSAITTHAWERVYRRLEHGRARNNLNADRYLLSSAGDQFVRTFIEAQRERLTADYNPNAPVSLSNARNAVRQAEAALRNLPQLPEDERRFLAAQSLFDNR